jgi:hypothetical protein
MERNPETTVSDQRRGQDEPDHPKELNVRKIWLFIAAILSAAGPMLPIAPTAQATICGSVGGRHVDVSGCADPLSELNGVLQYPPPPPPPGAPPPPPPPVYVPAAPNVDVCASVGRRISISGCV